MIVIGYNAQTLYKHVVNRNIWCSESAQTWRRAFESSAYQWVLNIPVLCTAEMLVLSTFFFFHLTNLVNINAIIKRWMKTLLIKRQTICCTIILLPQYVLTINTILPNFTTRMKAFQKTSINSFFPSHKAIGCESPDWSSIPTVNFGGDSIVFWGFFWKI